MDHGVRPAGYRSSLISVKLGMDIVNSDVVRLRVRDAA
jgi:hypothetical protein